MEHTTDRTTVLQSAIEDDLTGQPDVEGRSKLDYLITELQSFNTVDRAEWRDVAVASITEKRSVAWWGAFERFVVLAHIANGRLGERLEELMAAYGVKEPRSRGILYSILDACGKAPSAADIAADQELRNSDFLRWLDLLVAHLPKPTEAQEIILSASREGRFSFDNFIQRLDEMRAVGGSRLSKWLGAYRATLSNGEALLFDKVAEEAYRLKPQQLTQASAGKPTSTVDAIRTYEARSEPSTMAWSQSAACLALIRNSTSYNHSKLVQYYYLTSQKHKDLKDAFYKKSRDPRSIALLLERLLNYSNRELFSAVTKNFSYLRTFFRHRAGSAPRISLKGNYFIDAENTVVSIFRDHFASYLSDTAIEHNTGFYSIKNSGRYFLENDIPAAAIFRSYVNPRLDHAKLFSAANAVSRSDALRVVTENWEEYWKDYEPDKRGDKSFYKSTMIIPLTLWDNEISPEFIESTKEKLPEIDRSVFGFLCFDHTQTGYFDPRIDLPFGKIFADILCTYVFIRMVFLDLSNTFAEVETFLGKKQLPLKVHRLSKNERNEISSAESETEDEMRGLTAPTVAIPEPTKLVRTDLELLKFVGSPKAKL
jgi:hypothetical protein